MSANELSVALLFQPERALVHRVIAGLAIPSPVPNRELVGFLGALYQIKFFRVSAALVVFTAVERDGRMGPSSRSGVQSNALQVGWAIQG